MLTEVWKDVAGYEGIYMISNLGKVKSLKRKTQNRSGSFIIKERVLTIRKNYYGYPTVKLCKHNKGIAKTLHRIIAKAFIPNPEGFPEINHIDGNKDNYTISNLEWCSRSHNMKEAFRIGLISHKGENNTTKKLNTEKVKEIRMKISLGKTNQEIAKDYGVTHQCINLIRKNVSWRLQYRSH